LRRQHAWSPLRWEDVNHFGSALDLAVDPLKWISRVQPGFGVIVGKCAGDEGGNDTAAVPTGMREGVAHEVHAAALRCMEIDDKVRAFCSGALAGGSPTYRSTPAA
jgi:hypothetical protein